MKSNDHWEHHVHTWQHSGSPLRACTEDVQGLQQAVLLGVTPARATKELPA